MVCTLKHLSLCPEMEALYLFNPENDMALACGDPYYMAPASARRLADGGGAGKRRPVGRTGVVSLKLSESNDGIVFGRRQRTVVCDR